jgi:NarL family two-component system sensor histidine kinase LiaS
MDQILRRPRGLQWRLTLSYTILSVVAVLGIGVVFVSLANRLVFDSDVFPSLIASNLTSVAPEATTYLARRPADVVGLNRWLASDALLRRMRLPFDVDVTTGQAALLAVADRDGKVLATSNPALAPVGDRLADHLTAEKATVLRAALAGDSDPSHYSVRASDGSIATAAAVVGSDGQTLGALVLIPDGPALVAEVWRRTISALLLGAVALTVLFGLVGTLFGFFWVRWLTRRLCVLTGAVDAWGKGDLDVVAGDATDDEIGQLAKQLNRMAEELRGLLQARQMLAVVDERQRLARDLHDAVKQQVFATAMQVGAARVLVDRDPDAAKEHLAQAERLATEAQQELSALIRQLRPVALIERGLIGAVQNWARDWSRQSSIQADVRVSGTGSMSLAGEQALFRVVQEALANVARHSDATAVEIHMVWTDNTLELAVADNGRGFAIDQATGKGLGLSSMRERLEALGGTLTVESGSHGTRVTARVRT